MLCGGVAACHTYGMCNVRCVHCYCSRTEHSEQYTSDSECEPQTSRAVNCSADVGQARISSDF